MDISMDIHIHGNPEDKITVDEQEIVRGYFLLARPVQQASTLSWCLQLRWKHVLCFWINFCLPFEIVFCSISALGHSACKNLVLAVLKGSTLVYIWRPIITGSVLWKLLS